MFNMEHDYTVICHLENNVHNTTSVTKNLDNT